MVPAGKRVRLSRYTQFVNYAEAPVWPWSGEGVPIYAERHEFDGTLAHTASPAASPPVGTAASSPPRAASSASAAAADDLPQPLPLLSASSRMPSHHPPMPLQPTPSEAPDRGITRAGPRPRFNATGAGVWADREAAPHGSVADLARFLVDELWLSPSQAQHDRELDLHNGYTDVPFCLSADDSVRVAHRASELFLAEPSLLQISGQVKMFGDIHGQLDDLRRLWTAFGSPDSTLVTGDIDSFTYIFIGDFVDRGYYSLEVYSF